MQSTNSPGALAAGARHSIDGAVKSEVVSSTAEETPKGPPWRALFAFTTPSHMPLVVVGVVVSAIAGAALPASYLMVGELLTVFTSYGAGTITKQQFLHDAEKYILYLVAIAAASWIFHSLEFMIWLAFGELQAKSARDRLFHGLLQKEIAWYDMRKNGIGALLPRIQAQIRELQLATAQPLGSLFTQLSTAILALVQAFVKSWDLTLVTLSTVPVIMILAALVGKGMQKNLEKQQDKLTEAQKYSTSAFSAIDTVKCFNGEEIELEKYKKSINAAAGWYAWVANAAALQMALVMLLSISMFVQGFYYGALLVAKGRINAGDVVTTFFSAIIAFESIQEILPQMIVFEKGRAAGSTLRTIVAQIQGGSSIERTPGLLRPSSCVGNISVRNVSFAYPARPNQLAIEDLTLYIKGGEMTFLIGKSGSGKSTIGQLLMRFYELNNGQILVDNMPLEQLDTEWLRSNITLVEQTSLLFSGTVSHNIALGRKDHANVSRKVVTEAAEFALLQLMVNDMPDGLDTEVGFKGDAMSGGQRQRMALARARIRDTPILILDESTSALDHITRTLIMDAVRRWRQGKTTIIITHDISQIHSDDYVYLLENGSLVEEGYRSHMQMDKHSPFHSFLSEDQLTMASADEDLGKIAFNLESKDPSELSSSVRTSSDIDLEPLEMALNMTEERVAKDVSFIPDALANGSPLIGVRPYGTPGSVLAALASPLLRSAASPARDWSISNLTRMHQAEAVNFATSGPEEKVESQSGRSSPILKDFIHYTGRLAADARLKISENRPRRYPVGDSMAIPLTSSGAPTKSLDANAMAKKPDRMNSLKCIFRTLWPSLNGSAKAYLFMGFWGATVHAVASPVFSYVISRLIDTFSIPGGDKKASLKYSLFILCIAVVDASHTWLFRFLHEYTSQLWVDQIRFRAFERIMDQSKEFFEKEENGVSTLTGSLDRNAEEMRNLLGRFASLAYVAVVMVVASLAWAISAQWKMTLISLAVAPFIFGVTKMFARVSELWEGRSNDASEKAAAIFAETFTNIKTVRALTLESHFLDKYIKATEHSLRVGFQRAFYAGFFYGVSDSTGNFGVALVFYVGSRLAANGTEVKAIVQVFIMLIFLIGQVTTLLEYIPQIGSSKDTAARLLRLAKLPKESHESLGDTRITTVGNVIFDKLVFSYPSRPKVLVLHGISLRLEPGKATAIVGGSGSGKSTIANLLLNLYGTASVPECHPGDLTFGGRDIKHIFTPSLRAAVVPVSQTPMLFAATLAENIAYGLPAGSPFRSIQSIETAARQAGIHDFIASLPSGYDTLVGEGGMGLSGGQSQRVAIARALVRKPSVLILDEATSALDIEAANLIRHTIKDLLDSRHRTMTVIIITHHRDMMELAERVVVLEHGRIVEEGPFAELMSSRGALVDLLSGGVWDADRRKSRESESRVNWAPGLRDVDWAKKASDMKRSRFGRR